MLRWPGEKIVPNAVQHNVPAWAIFAMFLLPSLCRAASWREKRRQRVPPQHHAQLLPAADERKIIVYVIVCMIQFLLMLSVGLSISYPCWGYPSWWWATVFSVSACSPWLRHLQLRVMGDGGHTGHHRAPGGHHGGFIHFIIIGARGIWVPPHIMPEVMRKISAFSPLNWSLNGFLPAVPPGAHTADVLVEGWSWCCFSRHDDRLFYC